MMPSALISRCLLPSSPSATTRAQNPAGRMRPPLSGSHAGSPREGCASVGAGMSPTTARTSNVHIRTPSLRTVMEISFENGEAEALFYVGRRMTEPTYRALRRGGDRVGTV